MDSGKARKAGRPHQIGFAALFRRLRFQSYFRGRRRTRDIYRSQPVITGETARKALLACNYVTTPTILPWRRNLLAVDGFNETMNIGEDHDRYHDRVADAAHDLGVTAIFTSDVVLNPCPNGWLQSDTIGRISIDAAAVSDRRGALAPERLASQFYLLGVGSSGSQFA
jgi:hypothetical protein